jgi:hypothetical protein
MKRCLLGLVCLFISIHSFGQSLETDRQALMAIYYATEGVVSSHEYFNDITGWNVGDNPCGWTGVTCEGGRVTGLDLSMFQVHGPIAPEIGNLTALKYLNLQGGGLEFLPWLGEIPVELGSLTNLEYLNLSGNDFTGTNMHVIGSLTKLNFLAFDTPTSWVIPASFQNLVNLEHLYFGVRGGLAWPEMGSVGGIPAYFGNFVKLKTLSMPWAGLTEQLPSSLGNLLNLEVLDLHHNNLQSLLPASFNKLTNLKTLDLSENAMFGPIPSLAGIPVSATVSIQNNDFNFDGMQSNIGLLGLIDNYSPQAKLMIGGNFPLGGGAFDVDLFVYAGGTKANNTYRWYKNGVLQATNVGSEYFHVFEQSVYRVEVTNSMVPGLTLVSDDYLLPRLPVHLVSFTGKSQAGSNKLVWKTAEEINNKGFEIERSKDGVEYEMIGFVDGNGDTKEDKTYHFTDTKPFAMAYYRLKQIDYDGKFEYSKIISVKSDGAIVRIYPNPAREYLTISGINRKQKFSIVDQNGRVVLEGLAGEKEQIDIVNLGTGRYVVRVDGESINLLINR